MAARKPNLQAVVEAISEELTELAGFRSTRLTTAAADGDTTIHVETTLDWDADGAFVLAGISYAYASKTATTLAGITHSAGGATVNGISGSHAVQSSVVDYSRTFNFLDKVRAQVMSRTATGENLSALGRNLGVPRNRISDDTLFREIVQTLAYLPRGTVYGLELALTAFYGAGNFHIREDLPDNHNTVFVELLNTLATDPAGHAYLAVRERVEVSGGLTVATISREPQFVVGVRLADERRDDDFSTDLPTDLLDLDLITSFPAWEFDGDDEADVTVDAEGLLLAPASGHTASYYRNARCVPESRARFGIMMRAVDAFSAAAASALQATLNIRNGAFDVGVGTISDGGSNLQVGFLDKDNPGHLLRVGATFPAAQSHHVEIRISSPDRYTGVSTAELWVDGRWHDSENVASFPTIALNEVRFGSADSVHVPAWRVKSVNSHATTHTDYWNSPIVVNTSAFSNQGTVTSGNVTSADIGKSVRSPSTNARPGKWVLAAYNNGTHAATFQGRPHKSAHVNPLTGGRVTVTEPGALTYPDDFLNRLVLSGSGVGNNGSYAMSSMLDAVDLTPVTDNFGPFMETNAVVVTSPPPFVAEEGLTWRVDPRFTALTGVPMELVGSGSFVGAVLTMRQAIPIATPTSWPVLVDVTYATMRSAHALQDVDVANDPVGTWCPFYLPQAAFGRFQKFMKDLTAAGVIPEVKNL